MKRRFSTLLAVFLCALLLVGMFAACGASGGQSSDQGAYGTGETYDAAATEEAVAEGGETTSSDSSEASENPSASGRKLIYYRDLTIETTAYDDLLQTIDDLIAENGAYIDSSDESGSSMYGQDDRSCWMTIRVPAEKLDAFEEALGNALGDTAAITHRSERTEDITLSYTDVESHISALETEQERLLELLEQAETVEDLITIETRLSEIRYQLEDYESTRRLYDSQVSYSYVNLSIREVTLVSNAADASMGERMAHGLTETFADIAAGAQNLAVWVVVNLPYLVLWAVLVFLLVVIIRFIGRRRNKKFASRSANLPQNPQSPPPGPKQPPQNPNP